MSPTDRLLWAIAPNQQRSLSLILGGIAVFTALGGIATVVEIPRTLGAVMTLVMLIAWLVGMCGMIGYFRWYFGRS